MKKIRVNSAVASLSAKEAAMHLTDGHLVQTLVDWNGTCPFRRALYRALKRHFELKTSMKRMADGTILIAGGLTRQEAAGKLSAFLSSAESAHANAQTRHSSHTGKAKGVGNHPHADERAKEI